MSRLRIFFCLLFLEITIYVEAIITLRVETGGAIESRVQYFIALCTNKYAGKRTVLK